VEDAAENAMKILHEIAREVISNAVREKLDLLADAIARLKIVALRDVDGEEFESATSNKRLRSDLEDCTQGDILGFNEDFISMAQDSPLLSPVTISHQHEVPSPLPPCTIAHHDEVPPLRPPCPVSHQDSHQVPTPVSSEDLVFLMTTQNTRRTHVSDRVVLAAMRVLFAVLSGDSCDFLSCDFFEPLISYATQSKKDITLAPKFYGQVKSCLHKKSVSELKLCVIPFAYSRYWSGLVLYPEARKFTILYFNDKNKTAVKSLIPLVHQFLKSIVLVDWREETCSFKGNLFRENVCDTGVVLLWIVNQLVYQFNAGVSSYCWDFDKLRNNSVNSYRKWLHDMLLSQSVARSTDEFRCRHDHNGARCATVSKDRVQRDWHEKNFVHRQCEYLLTNPTCVACLSHRAFFEALPQANLKIKCVQCTQAPVSKHRDHIGADHPFSSWLLKFDLLCPKKDCGYCFTSQTALALHQLSVHMESPTAFEIEVAPVDMRTSNHFMDDIPLLSVASNIPGEKKKSVAKLLEEPKYFFCPKSECKDNEGALKQFKTLEGVFKHWRSVHYREPDPEVDELLSFDGISVVSPLLKLFGRGQYCELLERKAEPRATDHQRVPSAYLFDAIPKACLTGGIGILNMDNELGHCRTKENITAALNDLALFQLQRARRSPIELIQDLLHCGDPDVEIVLLKTLFCISADTPLYYSVTSFVKNFNAYIDSSTTDSLDQYLTMRDMLCSREAQKTLHQTLFRNDPLGLRGEKEIYTVHEIWTYYSSYALEMKRVRDRDRSIVGYEIAIEKVLLLLISLAALYSDDYVACPTELEAILKVDGLRNHRGKQVKVALTVRNIGLYEQSERNIFPVQIVNKDETPETFTTVFPNLEKMVSKLSSSGIEFYGQHVNVEFRLVADLKCVWELWKVTPMSKYGWKWGYQFCPYCDAVVDEGCIKMGHAKTHLELYRKVFDASRVRDNFLYRFSAGAIIICVLHLRCRVTEKLVRMLVARSVCQVAAVNRVLLESGTSYQIVVGSVRKGAQRTVEIDSMLESDVLEDKNSIAGNQLDLLLRNRQSLIDASFEADVMAQVK
jgi:hypothetical protein